MLEFPSVTRGIVVGIGSNTCNRQRFAFKNHPSRRSGREPIQFRTAIAGRRGAKEFVVDFRSCKAFPGGKELTKIGVCHFSFVAPDKAVPAEAKTGVGVDAFADDVRVDPRLFRARGFVDHAELIPGAEGRPVLREDTGFSDFVGRIAGDDVGSAVIGVEPNDIDIGEVLLDAFDLNRSAPSSAMTTIVG